MASTPTGRRAETEPSFRDEDSKNRSKLPKWLPVSMFIATSFALAIPVFMIRRHRGNAIRTSLKEVTPPPRRQSTPTGRFHRPTTHSSTSSSAVKLRTESPSESSSPGMGELLSAMSRLNLDTALLAGKAFAIATCLVAAGGVTLTWVVKSWLGVQDAREFGIRMRVFLWNSIPQLRSRIYRPPETEDERRQVFHATPLTIDEKWNQAEAEKRMQKAYDEGGFTLWAQTAMREAEIEATLERTKRQNEIADSIYKSPSS